MEKQNLQYCGICVKPLDTDSGKYVVKNNIGNKIIVCFDCFNKRIKGESK
jgi:hypothetical protein